MTWLSYLQGGHHGRALSLVGNVSGVGDPGAPHRISPRPLLMVAVERDQIVPNEEMVEAFAVAKAPKKLVWLPRHLGH